MNKEKKIKKWIGSVEFYSYPHWTFWARTGKHICCYIQDNSMGGKNKGRCIICGKRRV